MVNKKISKLAQLRIEFQLFNFIDFSFEEKQLGNETKSFDLEI